MAPVSPSLRLHYSTFRLPPSALGGLLLVLALCFGTHARASEPVEGPPERSDGWNRATNIMALSSAAAQLLMPRVFYSDPEVTVGWKARWHASVLAPSMTLLALSLVNEQYLKDEFGSLRPDCENDSKWYSCREYGLFSSQAMLAFSSLGQGAGVFVVDTVKWSDGRFNVGGFLGNVGVPLVLSVLTAVGRTAGNWESGGQVWTSAGVGVGAGFGMGLLYAMAQRPECGYSGGLVCW